MNSWTMVKGSEMYPCTGQAVLSSTVIAAPWKVNMTQRLHVFARMVLPVLHEWLTAATEDL